MRTTDLGGVGRRIRAQEQFRKARGSSSGLWRLAAVDCGSAYVASYRAAIWIVGGTVVRVVVETDVVTCWLEAPMKYPHPSTGNS